MTKQITNNDSKLLIGALGANGFFSALSGIAMVLVPASIAQFLGLSQSGPIFDLGIMLILFGATLLYYYFRKSVRKLDAIVVSILDLAWVLGSVAMVLAAGDLFSAAGITAIFVVGIVVLTFFDLQVYALWQLGRKNELPGHIDEPTIEVATD